MRSAIPIALALCLAAGAQAQSSALTDQPGDPVQGREIMLDLTTSLCLLCHAGPFSEVPYMGTLAPDLTGIGARLTLPELRAQIMDSRSMNPATIMPPFFSHDGLNRVGPRWQDKTILTAQQVEDVAAYLATLTRGSP